MKFQRPLPRPTQIPFLLLSLLPTDLSPQRLRSDENLKAAVNPRKTLPRPSRLRSQLEGRGSTDRLLLLGAAENFWEKTIYFSLLSMKSNL